MVRKLRVRRLVLGIASLAFVSAVAFGVYLLPAVAGSFDNMYQTLNATWDCDDEGSSTPPDAGARFCQTDNSTLTFYSYSSISVTGRARISNSLNNDFDSTDLSVSYDSTPSFSGGSETDIIYDQRDDVPDDKDGLAWCDDSVSFLKCDQHYVAFLSDTPSTALICHESGHAVGLTHGSDAYPARSDTSSTLGCLRNPVSPTTLGSHNEGEINATY